MSSHGHHEVLCLATVSLLSLSLGCPGDGGEQPLVSLVRDFELPLPLFAADSAWNQRADGAAVHSDSDAIILSTYRVLRGDVSHLVGGEPFDWTFFDFNIDDWSYPISRSSSATTQILLCEYEGQRQWPNAKFLGDYELGGPIAIDSPVGPVRAAGPAGISSDGHLVLLNPDTGREWDLWQATTQRSGECQSAGGGIAGDTILEAGYADFFDVTGDGINPAGVYSAKAAGTPLLAGLLVPEDIEAGVIAHPLGFAIPGPRNLSGTPNEVEASEYAYPASTTESDFYSTDPHAMITGQRIRLRTSLVDSDGQPIDESALTPATRMVLRGLRDYGAVMLDNASAFAFYAEDVHTGKLDLDDDTLNALIGEAAGTPLPEGKTRWQIVIERVYEEMSRIPIAQGDFDDGDNPSTATLGHANFEVVEFATRP